MNNRWWGLMHFRLRSLWQLTVLSICLTVVCGCTKSKVLLPVSGTVHVSGKPAKGALVLFHPVDQEGGVTASGVADEDGVYTLVTAQKDGVEAGKYRVTITWPDPSKIVEQVPGGMLPEDPPDLLKGRYGSLKSTTLEAEVEPGETELKPFELDLPK